MTEPNTQRGWEEKLMDEFCVTFERAQDETVVERLEAFIATELTKAREEGRDEMIKESITMTAYIVETERIKKEAIQSYRQELRKKVEGMKKDYEDKNGEYEMGIVYGNNKLLEDLLTIISE